MRRHLLVRSQLPWRQALVQGEDFLWFLRQNGLLRISPALEDVITSWFYISSAGKFLSTVDEKGLHPASNPCRETSWGALNYP